MIGVGRSLSFVRNGEVVAITAAKLTRAQVMSVIQGSPLADGIPELDGAGPPRDLQLGARRVTVQSGRRGEEILIRISIEAPPEPPMVAAPPAPAPAPPAPPVAAAPPAPPSFEAMEIDLSLGDLPHEVGLAAAPAPVVSLDVGFDVRAEDGLDIDLELPGLELPGFSQAAAAAAAPIVAPVSRPPTSEAAARTTRAPVPELRASLVPTPPPSAFADLSLDDLTLDPAPDPAAPPPAPSAPGPRAKSPSRGPRAKSPSRAPEPRARRSTRAPEPTEPARSGRSTLGALLGDPLGPPAGPSLDVPVDAIGPPGGLSLEGPPAGRGDGRADAFGPPADAFAPPTRARARTVPPPTAFGPPPAAFGPPSAAPVIAAAPMRSPSIPIRRMPTGVPFVELVRAAADLGASDLHIATGRTTSIRLLGELVPLDSTPPLPVAEAEALLLPLLSGEQLDRLEAQGYVDLAITPPTGGRLRANISRHAGGLKGTFRIARAAPSTLEELGLPAELAKVVNHHQGLVVIASPSGHGKTTTLAALVQLINATHAHHIVTIEDPIEIVYPKRAAVVSQREVGPNTRSFAAALEGSLRQDPDVIVIGELRDRETVELALTASETGHLVLATMGTPSAAKTIDRLVDMFPPDDQPQVRASIAGALRAVVAQRLLPTADARGVVPAVELLTGVLPLANMIRDDKLFQLPNLMKRGRSLGMIRFDDALTELVRAGTISIDTAIAASDNKRELTSVLRPGAPSQAGPDPAKKPGLGNLFGRRDRE